ncbi:hypothetical protein H2199_000437 [Coniosporium tulheliwenetii]|uniref:Uncharacterized protein n=1 Tax=Coniosporium tulheliwenetii TaxID=3383036 RepID=A0ACC2ZQI7_9PEZI|nr:hypothetical protein H2199_000437 [Cladosporium sp. JES 115]
MSRHLENVTGAPGTINMRNRWLNLFESFCKETLKHRPGTVPAGPDLERLFLSVPTHLNPLEGRDGAISFGYLKRGLSSVIEGLTFQHTGFHLTSRDSVHMKAVFSQYLKNGVLTKDPTREQLWLTCEIVHRMATALLDHGLTQGTYSWDVLLSKTLGLVLQAALCARAGDIRRSRDWEGMEFMRYEHIDIRLVERDGTERLAALVNIAYSKGFKDDQSNNHKAELWELGSEHNAADAIKLIIVMALRTGAVAETSWDALYTAMRGRSPKAIEWAHPERPLFNAYLSGGVGIDFSRPALAKQQTATLQLAGELTGLLSTPWTHDLRRGAAADIAHLPQPLLFGTSTPAVASALGHRPNTVGKALTDEYIGRSREDNWLLRLNAAEKDTAPDNFGPTFGATPFRPRKRSPDEVIAACVRLNTDPNDPNARKRAKYRLRAEMKEDWVKESIAARGQQQPTSSTSTSPARTEANTPPNLAPSDLVPPHLVPCNMAPLDPTALDSARIDAVEIDSDPNVSLDPALLVLGDYFFGSSSDVTASTPEVDPDVAAETLFVPDANDGLSENMASLDNMDDHEAADILTSDRDVFVTYFSKINTMALFHRPCDSRTPRGSLTSRDPPTGFIYACPNKPYGCTWTGPAKTMCNDYFRSCKSTSTEAHLALAKEKDISSSTSAEAHPEPAEGSLLSAPWTAASPLSKANTTWPST